MIELWQAVVLLLVGASVGLGSSYLQRRWTRSDTRDAEEREAERRVAQEDREARRRVEAEQRQARRQYRGERMQPVLEFLELALQYQSGETAERALLELYETNVQGIQDRMSRRRFLASMRRDPSFTKPDFIQLSGALSSAVAAAPTSDMMVELAVVFTLVSDEELATGGKAQVAVKSVREMIERYVVEV